ncbi:MAG TPA: VOC family protein [Albitalea sp.]|nr:VOC family protein [Albitalea sp.]
MPALDTYLFFDGTCAEAMRFYERTLGGKIEMMMTQAESPMRDQAPPGAPPDQIIHARLALGDRKLMASDWCVPDEPYGGMKGFSLSLEYQSVAEAQKIFDALSQGGKVTMPMQKTFWAENFGMLVDRFGTAWMVTGGERAH